MSQAEREAGFNQVWSRLKPSSIDLLRVTERELKSLLHDAYVTGWLDAELHAEPASDICGFCGQPGADKIPHPVRWPGESSAGTELVHAECEDEECRRAHAALSDKEREAFLRTC